MRTNADLRHIFPVISGTITDGAGTTYSLTGRDIPSGSLSFKAGTSPAGTFAVGGAVISSVSFALLNAASYASLVWKNAKVTFTLTCDQTPVSMGEYYIVNHSEAGGAITVTAFDALKILDSYEMHELNITYPTTIGTLATAIATAHGLTVTGIRNPSMTIEDPEDDRMTQRACISYLAQLSGQYVTVAGSVIRFGWYDIASPVSNGNTFGHDWGTADVTITGVRVNDKDSTQVEDRGSAGYRIEIAGNPFITATNVSAVADTVWAACGGMSFRAGSAEILASPAFEAGDVVTVNTPDEQNVKLILSNITYTPDVSMAITSDADAQDGDLALNKSPYVKHGEDARQEADAAIDEQLADPNSALSQAIAAGGGGGGSGGEWVLITSTIALFSRYSSRGIDQPGASTGWMIDDSNGFQTIDLVGEAKQIHLGAPAAGSAWGDKTWQQIPDWQEAYGKTFILPLYMDVKMGTAANAEVYSGIVEMPCRFYGSTQAAYEANAGRTIEMLYDPVHPPVVVAAPKQAALVGMVGIPFAPMRTAAQGSSRAAVKYLNYTGRDPGDRDIRVFSFDWHVNPA